MTLQQWPLQAHPILDLWLRFLHLRHGVLKSNGSRIIPIKEGLSFAGVQHAMLDLLDLLQNAIQVAGLAPMKARWVIRVSRRDGVVLWDSPALHLPVAYSNQTILSYRSISQTWEFMMLQLRVVLDKSIDCLSLSCWEILVNDSNALVLIETMTIVATIALAVLLPSYHLVHSSHNPTINAAHQQATNTSNILAQVVQQARQPFKILRYNCSRFPFFNFYPSPTNQ